MRFLNIGLGFSLILLLSIMIGCSSTGSSAKMGEKSSNKVSSNENLTLEDYLRRLNGVQVSGSGNNIRVTIRSNMSVTKSTEQPLFVLNGRKIGKSYSQVVSIINSENIISVEAIPPSRATLYGNEGGGGVIVIKTK